MSFLKTMLGIGGIVLALHEQATIFIDGVDGSEWCVHGPGSVGSPVRLLEGSVGDLVDPPVSTTYKARVGQAGSQYRGHKVQARNVVMDFIVCAADGVSWARVDSDFRKAFAFDRDTVIRVITPLSGERYLRVRLEETPEFKNEIDPHEQSASQYTYTLIAGDPYWYSDTHKDSFVFDGMNWYGGGVWVDNPTDVDCWPKWVLTDQARFILPDWDSQRTIVLPFMTQGTRAVVDTDPMAELITTENDVLTWADMNGQFFMNPIPGYTDRVFVPVSVDPLPRLDIVLPPGWREWIAKKLGEWATRLGADGVLKASAGDVAAEVRKVITGATPPFLKPLSDTVIGHLTLDFISQRIAEAYGSVANIAGATAQVRLERRWSRPWGLE